MYAFYEESSGNIISLVDASSLPTAPQGYGYLPCSYDISDLYKYEVVSGSIQLKSKSEIDNIEGVEAWSKLRSKRDQMLSQTDWTQMNDSPLSASKRTEWATYRQSLRDLPSNTSDPANPTFPTEPS